MKTSLTPHAWLIVARRTFCTALFLACVLPSFAGEVTQRAHLDDVLSAIDHATVIHAAAYFLSPRSAIYAHLQNAASRGAQVYLTLTGDGMGYAVRMNREIAAANRAMHVTLLSRPIHLKAVVTNTGAVFVCDTNFARRSIIFSLPTTAQKTVLDAMQGHPTTLWPLTTRKDQSLKSEASVVDSARRTLDIETESFGPDNDVFTAIMNAHKRGVRIHLAVAATEARESRGEAALLSSLEHMGLRVSIVHATDKIAIADQTTAFSGSVNANRGVMHQIDWGLATTSVMLIASLQRRFDANVR